MKNFKHILAILLVVFLMATLIPAVFADDPVYVWDEDQTAGGINYSDNYSATIVSAGEADASLTINGDVTQVSDIQSYPINAEAYNGNTATCTVNGNVFSSAQENAEAVWGWADGGNVVITVNGDVTATGAQYYNSGVSGFAQNSGTVDITVTGSVVSDDYAINLDDPDAVSITVWKASINEDFGTVSNGFDDQINYIVLSDQLPSGGTVSLDGTAKKGDFDVAREGETVTVKVDVEDGYAVKGVYNGTCNEVELTQNEDGSFSLVVPKGGAVYLSAYVGTTKIIHEEIGKAEISLPDGSKGSIVFYKNGSFDVLNADGGVIECGYYRALRSGLALFNRRGTKMPVDENGKVTYIFAGNGGNTAEFTLGKDVVSALTGK